MITTVTEKESQLITALQRVTEALNIATQERDALRLAAQALFNDCLASDFNEHWDSYTQLQAALKGKS